MRVSATFLCLLAGQAMAASPAARHDGAVEPVVQDGVFQLPFFTVAAEVELLEGGNGTTGTATTKRQVPTGLDKVKYGGARPVMALGVTIELGTPPQKVLVEPDTASYQLWVPGGTTTDGGTGAEPVYFDSDASTSKQDRKMKSAAAYGTSEMVEFDIISDEVSVGGKSLGKLNFGVGDMTSRYTRLGRIVGVIGLLPAPPGRKGSTDSVPQMLLNKKVTKSSAFGMALRQKGRGQLTFGGYDTSKFSGPLEKLPILPNGKNYPMVSLQSVSFTASSCGSSEVVLDNQTTSRDLSLGIDSGAPGLGLEDDLFEMLEAKLQAKPSSPLLTVPCDLVDAGASLHFKMTDRTIVSVPLADMLHRKVDSDKNCILALQKSASESDLWIGGHFLRRSFVLFDPDDKSVYVARGADCGSSIVAIDGKMPTDAVKGKCSEEPAVAE
ncbi:hypothetical protein ARSEF1564_007692 [Beauveria bassiana]